MNATCPAGVFDGMDEAALQALLAEARTAYTDLMLGRRPTKVSYTQGDGSRSVEYTPTTLIAARMLIGQLQQALGLCCRGRAGPITPIF